MSEPSPVAPLVAGAGLAAAVAAIVCRLFTTGGGIELFQPGAQLLFDGLALCAALFVMLARVLARETPLAGAGRLLLPLGVFVLALVVSAARAPHADLAWRTALSWTSLLILGLTVRELGEDRRVAVLLASFVLACGLAGACLGIWEYLVEIPALQAEYSAGALEGELSVHERSYRIALDERIKSRAATGPYLLPGMLACVMCMLLPLAGVTAWTLRRRPLGAVVGVPAVLLFALLLSKSKGAVVTAAGTAMALLLLHPAPALVARRRTLLYATGALALGVLALGLVVFLAGPERIGIGLSFTVRLEYWSAGLAMWLDQPLFGVGLNNYRDFFGAAKSLRAEETLHAHNAPLQLLAETGLLGVLACGWLVVAWARTGWRSLAAPGEEGKPEEEAGTLGPRAAAQALLAGCLLGLVLLAGFGDAYDANRPGHLVFVAVVLLAGTRLLYACLLEVDPRVLGAAALAGASALLWDGLLNFGLHQAGVFTLAWLLAGSSPALAGATPEHFTWERPRQAAAFLLAALTMLVLAFTPGAVTADQRRAAARAEHAEAIRLLQAGRERRRAQDLLDQAVLGYLGACERYPWDARTWLELSGALRTLSTRQGQVELHDRAIDAARQATGRNPRAADAHNQLGRLLASQRAPDLLGAREAFDAAVQLYPSHPGYLLDAGKVRVALLRQRRPADPAPLKAEARRLLEDAGRASETTRLVRRRLSPGEEALRRRLLDGLGTD